MRRNLDGSPAGLPEPEHCAGAKERLDAIGHSGGRSHDPSSGSKLLGISSEAARALARRQKWARRTPNERNVLARVLMPFPRN
jgi:hypothetical protein